jgi:hypothetical protein
MGEEMGGRHNWKRKKEDMERNEEVLVGERVVQNHRKKKFGEERCMCGYED